jgi:membrane-associated phospholipid phosphatase
MKSPASFAAEPLVRLGLATAAAVALTLFSIDFIDRPLAVAAAKLHLYRILLQSDLVHAPLMILAAVIGVVAGAVYFLKQKQLPKAAVAGMLMGLAVAWSECLIQFVLKPAFNRSDPLSYVIVGRYDFWAGIDVTPIGTFPSGHSAQAAAIMAVLWIFYPKWRPAYVTAFLAIAAALIVGEWHWLSDIVFGGFIGAVSGLMLLRIWRAVRPDDIPA